MLADYAASKGYDVLTTVNGGEGYWVNAQVSFAMQLPAGNPVPSGAALSAPSGWNLIAIGDNKTPEAFIQANNSLHASTIWAWDSAEAKWYYYAPSHAAHGTLSSYTAARGYLDFGTKTLDSGMGFWVAGSPISVDLPPPTPGVNPPKTGNLAPGWNLLGNGAEAPIDVPSIFGDPAKIYTVWKWAASSGTWAFYAPSLAAQGGTVLATYAASKGYEVLTTVNGGEGFWVLAPQVANVQMPKATSVLASDFRLGGSKALGPAWNLIALGENMTTDGFNLALSPSQPPQGTVPLNLTSLWAWNTASRKWYFYAPILKAQGGSALTNYISTKGYLDFASNVVLGSGLGFYVAGTAVDLATSPPLPGESMGPPTGVTAIAGIGSATVSFSAPASTGGTLIKGYTVTSYPGNVTASSSTSPITVTGLANGTTYVFSVAAANAAGTGPASVASNAVTPTVTTSPVSTTTTTTNSNTSTTATATTTTTVSATTTTTLAGTGCDCQPLSAFNGGVIYDFNAAQMLLDIYSTTLTFVAGWNLMGNSTAGSLDPVKAFGNATNVEAVWKWIASASKWAFYAPSLVGQALTDYATKNGYDVLKAINGGEGFWVNAKTGFTAQLAPGSGIASSSLSSSLVSGWSLVAIGDNMTPRAFANAIAAAPPTSDQAAISVTTLWAAKGGLTSWYFCKRPVKALLLE